MFIITFLSDASLHQEIRRKCYDYMVYTNLLKIFFYHFYLVCQCFRRVNSVEADSTFIELHDFLIFH